MHGVLTIAGVTSEATKEAVERALEGPFFWLDLDDGGDPATTALLRDTFGFHPLAVEDADHFGQRPKIDEYDDFSLLVMVGAQATAKGGSPTVEVHCFVSERFLVTVRRQPCDALDAVRARAARYRSAAAGSGGPGGAATSAGAAATPIGPPQVGLVYLVIDELVDSFFPVLARFDDRIDELEDAILENPTDEQLGTLFAMKRELIGLRKAVTAERDMFSGLFSGTRQLPGMTDEAGHYFRDVYDHIIRISDMVDSYRDLLSSVLDTHLSTVSNRLNVVMKQLTIIATVFLPLTFLTGFFGQNFAWMVSRITGLWAWLVFAVGMELVAAVLLVYLFRRRGWIGRQSAV